MRIDQAEAKLRQLLQAMGADPKHLAVGETWEAFKRFAVEPVATASDGLLFQAGTFDFYGPDRFIVDFVRQFEVVDNEERHEHYEQLHCEFLFEPNPDLRALDTFELWCFPAEGDSPDAFFEEVEGRPEFRAVVARTPISASVFQEAV